MPLWRFKAMDDSTEMVLIYSLAKLGNWPIVRKGTSLEQGVLQWATWGFTKSVLINILLGANCHWIMKGYWKTALFIQVCINTVCQVSGNMDHTVSVISVVTVLEYLCHYLAGTCEQDCLLLDLLFFQGICPSVFVLWFFCLDTKEESSSLSCAQSLTQLSETSCFISTIWIALSPQFDKGCTLC